MAWNCLTIFLGLILLLLQPAAGEEIQFNRDIRPILADNCFPCHGPDSAARQGELRLDTEDGAFAPEGILVRGKPKQSQLLTRLHHSDPAERMPPTDSGKSLSKKQIEKIRLWIEQGAVWQKHWAFVRPVRVDPPRHRSKWVRNEIDQFVLDQLLKRNLKPSPRATRQALIRRLSLDLIGLPPSVAEVEAFLEDDSAEAYEKVVDRLLESPHYGERMSQVWLDAARYADSHGYSLDRRRMMWPWRDWVIQAYNRNLSFRDFSIQQLAGDLLPEATVEQKLATGFNRNHPIQSEGGVINEEYRIETVVDRVETTSAVFLGLTMGCGRCHDHKYEPISQREFYSFFAFFNNVPETAHVGNADNQVDRPFVRAIPSQAQLGKLTSRLATLRERLANQPKRETAMRERVWIDDHLPRGAVAFGNGSGPDKFLFVDSSADHPVYSGKKSSARTSQGLGQHGFQGAAEPISIPAGTILFAHVFLDPRNPPREIMLQWNVGGSWEHRAIWGENLIPWGADGTSSRFAMGPLPEKGKWVRLEIPAEKVGLVGKQVSGWAFTQFDGQLHWDTAGWVSRQLSPQEQEINRLQGELDALRQKAPMVMVMSEMNPPRKTFVLDRGQYDAPTRMEVQPGIPAVLGKLPEGKRPDRLTLAEWMFSGENPLTSRVAVNRYWQMYFGTGLVESAEDFGTQGTPPSHPRLLDWLASEFVRSGWDVKAMQKKIVMSATYQQSSRISPSLRAVDPDNRLLARGSRFRLPAEAIRDQALFVSGLLVPRLGGKSVRPYQPPGLWKDVVYSNVPKFKQDHGEDLYRRSLYTYWKRSVPPPNLQALDAPSREACTLTRSRTNTPQGTLVLWNDPTFVEAARILAEKMTRLERESEQALELMFRSVLSRRPNSAERKLLIETHRFFLAEFREHPERAMELLRTGEFPRDEKLDAVEVAALTAVANALLGLDEALTRN